MVLTFIVGFGATFGAAEGIRASQAKSRREEHRTRKNNLIVHCPKSSQYSSLLERRQVVLSGDRLYIDTGMAHDVPFGHPFEGYYLPYPDTRYSGLVSTITHEAPIMNWVFVDRDTYQLRFGNRIASEGHLTGPYDCTRQDKRLTFAGWEGFCAVLEDGGIWGLYFDKDGDMLKRKLPGRVVIELELYRRELKTRKPEYVAPVPAPSADPPKSPTPPPSPPQEPQQRPEQIPKEEKEQDQQADEKERKKAKGSDSDVSQGKEEFAEKPGRNSVQSLETTTPPELVTLSDSGPVSPPEPASPSGFSQPGDYRDKKQGGDGADTTETKTMESSRNKTSEEEMVEETIARLDGQKKKMTGAAVQENLQFSLPALEEMIRSIKYKSPSVEDSDEDDNRLPPSPDVD